VECGCQLVCFFMWVMRRTITYVLIHAGQATGMSKTWMRPKMAIRGWFVVHAQSPPWCAYRAAHSGART
jgi:hypothetical protein